MNIRPMISALRRHKTASLLIVLEIALSCAIICNALFMVVERLDRLNQPVGVAQDQLLQIQLAGTGDQDNAAAMTREDLATLRAISGVEGATLTNQVPFSGSAWDTSLALSPDQEHHTLMAAMYLGSEGFLDVMGLNLIAGRDFAADEYQDFAAVMSATDTSKLHSPILISREAADRLFPDGTALGKTVYTANIPLTIVGIIDVLARPYQSEGNWSYSIVLPLRTTYAEGSYALRVADPGRRNDILAAATSALERIDPNRIVLNQRTYEDIRTEHFSSDRAMVWLLVVVCAALLVVTALGVVGLASFWVTQRTRQIGVRRALGATRGQILRYFQAENFLLTSAGIALGMLLAYALNQVLMTRYELPRLPVVYLPAGAVVLWLLGQAAVLWPARRAASVPPAIATRGA